MIKGKRILLFLVILFDLSTLGQCVQQFAVDVQCEWTAYTDGEVVVITTSPNKKTSTIEWGIVGQGCTPGRSSLTFQAPQSQYVNIGQEFLVGTLTHVNRTVQGGTAIDDATLKLTLWFNNSENREFSLIFKIEETWSVPPGEPFAPGQPCPYGGYEENGIWCCDDKIVLPYYPLYRSEPFYFPNCACPLVLILGFKKDGELANDLITKEGCSTTANLYGRIEINDTSPPIVFCPQSISKENDFSKCGAEVNLNLIVQAWDNSEISSIKYYIGTQEIGSPYFFPVGTTTVKAVATDVCGNSSECSFTVTVRDAEPPVIENCPKDLTVYTGSGRKTCDQEAIWDPPTARDNCEVASFTSTHKPGDTFPVGTTTVTYTAKDPAGNETSYSFKVTVKDNTPPEITCPANITVNNDLGKCGANVSFAAQAQDNCGIDSIKYYVGNTEITSPYFFPVGTTTVRAVATDVHGNSSECSFTVTVRDAEPPVIENCPKDLTVYTGSGRKTCDQEAIWDPPTARDNCEVASFTSTHKPGDTFPVGTTTVTYTAKDPAGNETSYSFKVTVKDNTPPEITCPQDITVDSEPDKCGATVAFTAQAWDNCEVSSIKYYVGTLEITSPHFFPPGTTTVTAIATDPAGNTDSCAFNVTVIFAPGISITKVADRASAKVGETITYTMTVRNTGNVYLSNVTVTESTILLIDDQRVPRAMNSLVGPFGDDGDGVLEFNEVWTYIGKYTMTKDDVYGSIVNKATVNAIDPCGNPIQAVSNEVRVTWEDSPPIARFQSLTTCKNTPVNFAFIASDPDIDPNKPEKHPLRFRILGAPNHGIVDWDPENIRYLLPNLAQISATYRPALDFVGEDILTFEVWDPQGMFDTGIVTINVQECGGEVVGEVAALSPIVINEIGWAGTKANPEDQWVELLNLTDKPIDLSGWVLRWRRKNPSTPEEEQWKEIKLKGSIPAFGFFLLERGHDEVVSDIPADLIFPTFVEMVGKRVELKFSIEGDVVELIDSAGNLVDTANSDPTKPDGWAAGSLSSSASMERVDPFKPDNAENWATNRGIIVSGRDAQGLPLTATARAANEATLLQRVRVQTAREIVAGGRLSITVPMPEWVKNIPGMPRLTVMRADAAGDIGSLVTPEEALAVQGRYVEELLHYEILVDSLRLAPGLYQIWITLGNHVFYLLTIEVKPAG
jgi:hypothetical protein